MPSQILLVGLSHKSTPLDLREAVSFSKEQLPRALDLLRSTLGAGAIVSTCNRTEVYTVFDSAAPRPEDTANFLSEFHGVPREAFAPYLYSRVGADAVRHLFRVSGGLDSMILGESEILGQVRAALAAATDADSADAGMLRLFHAAVRAGRRVREETDVGRNALSVSRAGVQLAHRVIGDLRGARVMLVGAGEAGKLVAEALRTIGVHDFMVANRTAARSEQLTAELGGRSIPFENVESAMSESDIVIAATDSPGHIITRPMVERARNGYTNGPLFVLDLAVPRDVDAGVADLDGVSLLNVDDLSSVVEDNLIERQRAAREAESVVEDEVVRFMAWWDALDVLPVITALHQTSENIRAREMEKALSKLTDLSDEQLRVVDALTRSIVKRLLHEPTRSLRQVHDCSRLELARDLFGLWKDPNDVS